MKRMNREEDHPELFGRNLFEYQNWIIEEPRENDVAGIEHLFYGSESEAEAYAKKIGGTYRRREELWQ